MICDSTHSVGHNKHVQSKYDACLYTSIPLLNAASDRNDTALAIMFV